MCRQTIAKVQGYNCSAILHSRCPRITCMYKTHSAFVYGENFHCLSFGHCALRTCIKIKVMPSQLWHAFGLGKLCSPKLKLEALLPLEVYKRPLRCLKTRAAADIKNFKGALALKARNSCKYLQLNCSEKSTQLWSILFGCIRERNEASLLLLLRRRRWKW